MSIYEEVVSSTCSDVLYEMNRANTCNALLIDVVVNLQLDYSFKFVKLWNLLAVLNELEITSILTYLLTKRMNGSSPKPIHHMNIWMIPTKKPSTTAYVGSLSIGDLP